MRPNPRDARLEYHAGIAFRKLDLPYQSPLVVAVSGGPDSMALLHYLARDAANVPPVAAGHVNHALRGSESDADAAFVRAAAKEWGIPYEEITLRAGSAHSEERARLARYEALGAIAARVGARRVLTAHTADDQAETVLLRLFRGAGLRGLAGMPVRGRVRGVQVVRPLLQVTREEIQEYLRRRGVEYRMDSTNETSVPARNFVRREVLPLVRARLNPSVRDALLRSAAAARDADELLLALARERFPEVIVAREPGQITLDATRIVQYPKSLRVYVFRLALQELTGSLREVAGAHIEALLTLATTTRPRSLDLPGQIRARRERGRIVLDLRMREAEAIREHPRA
jgi:tRNA(Ile)-lysidine synthase